MSKVYRMQSFFVDGIKWELLAISVARSFKFDVWASPVDGLYELEYRGRFIPNDVDVQTVCVEAEAFVRQQLENLKNNSSGDNITT